MSKVVYTWRCRQQKAEIKLEICNYLDDYCMSTSTAITEICHTTITNRKYVKKTKIPHNSEN